MNNLNDSNIMDLNDTPAAENFKDKNAFAVLSRMFKPDTKKVNILIVDDDVELTWLLKARLQKEFPSSDVETATDAYEAIEMVHNKIYNLILLDWNLQDTTGREMLNKMEHEFKIDTAIPDEWFARKANVVVLSADPREKCKIGKLDHFKYCGHINKANSLDNLINLVKDHYHKQ